MRYKLYFVVIANMAISSCYENEPLNNVSRTGTSSSVNTNTQTQTQSAQQTDTQIQTTTNNQLSTTTQTETKTETDITVEKCEQALSVNIDVIAQNNQDLQLQGNIVGCPGVSITGQYNWQFGDGVEISSNQAIVNHHYDVAGSYEVELRYADAYTVNVVNVQPDPIDAKCNDVNNYGEKTLKLLTSEQYNNSIIDLTDISLDAQYDINNVEFLIFLEFAQQIAQESMQKNFENILDCNLLSEKECVDKYFFNVLPVIYRQINPELSKSNWSYNIKFHSDLFEELDFSKAMKSSLITAFSSPQFLFHTTLGESKISLLKKIDAFNLLNKENEKIINRRIEYSFNDEQSDQYIPFFGLPLFENVVISHIALPIEGDYILSLYVRANTEALENDIPYIQVLINDMEPHTTQINSSETLRLDFNVHLKASNNSIILNRKMFESQTNNGAIFLDRLEISKNESTSLFVRNDSSLFDQYSNNDFILSNWEIASLLSFNYLGSVPDKELERLAITNKLDDSKIVERQITRLLNSERSILWGETHNIESITFPSLSCNTNQGIL
ncbi:DUF1592 domain-containing protein [Marinicellulosiphila megalodicopiae]|uniref:DUF1592 domain-containing protein n=1 Tax=Marinicellulosiphila megalodicopiae TaxID=2724896 RepID=UPI003BB19827